MTERVLTPVPDLCQGRLSAQAGTAVSTSDILGATSLYWVPYQGDLLRLYDGTRWSFWRFTEAVIPLGTLVAATNYDVFAWEDAGTLSYAIGPAWASDILRGAGPGTPTLAYQDGIVVNAYALSGGPGARAGRYLGTFRTTSTTTTEDSGGQVTSQVGGKRFVWNAQNRVPRSVGVLDFTDFWSYGVSAWRQANGVTGLLNSVEYVVGAFDVPIEATIYGIVALQNNSGISAHVGVGVNSVTVPTGFSQHAYNNDPSQQINCPCVAHYSAYARLGYSALAWLENGSDGTCAFFGQTVDSQAGMLAHLWA